MKATDSQIEAAIMHATVWENVFDECRLNANRQYLNPEKELILSSLATFALYIGGEYRRVANSGEVKE